MMTHFQQPTLGTITTSSALASRLTLLLILALTLGLSIPSGTAFASTPVPAPQTASADSNYVVTVRGTDFASDASVDVRWNGQDRVSYTGREVTHTTEDGLDVLRFTLTDPAKRAVLDADRKLQLWVVNPGPPSQWNPAPLYFMNDKPVPTPAPLSALSNAEYQVQVKGRGFASSAEIDVRVDYQDLITYKDSQLTRTVEGELDVIQFTLTDATKRQVLDQGGKLQLWVRNLATPKDKWNATPVDLWMATAVQTPVAQMVTTTADYVVTVRGTNFASNAEVHIRTGNGALPVKYLGAALSRPPEDGQDGQSVLRFTIVDDGLREVLDRGDLLRLWVYNPGPTPRFSPAALYFTKTPFSSTIRSLAPLGVLTPDQDKVFEVLLENPQPTSTLVNWRVVDYFGVQVDSGAASIPPGWTKASVRVSTNSIGHYVLEASVLGETLFGNFAIVNDRREYLADSPFGVNTFLTIYGRGKDSPPYDVHRTYELLDDYVRALKLSGVTWVRDAVLWTDLAPYVLAEQQPEPWLTRYFSAYHDAGLNVSAMFGWTPSSVVSAERLLLDENPLKMLPDDLTQAYEAGEKFAEYFGPRVSVWELYNEPEGDLGVSNVEGVDRYAAAVKALTLGFHESGAAVTMGGLSGRDTEAYNAQNATRLSWSRSWGAYQDALFDNGVLDYVDVYSFHNHQPNADPAQEKAATQAYFKPVTENVFLTSNSVAHLAKRDALAPSMPAWLNEAGGAIPNSPQGLDTLAKQQAQARFWVTSAVQSLATGVDKHFWHVGIQSVEELGNFKDIYWGSFSPYDPPTRQITPYAAYSAQAALTEALGSGEYQGTVGGLPTGAQGYVFRDGADTTLVLWADQEGRTARLNVGKPSVTQIDIMGRKTTSASVAGVVEVALGPDPIYLKVAGSIPASTYTSNPHVELPVVVQTHTESQRIVVDPIFPVKLGDNAKGPGGYQLPANVDSLVKVNVYNFNDTSVTGRVDGSISGGVGYTLTGPLEAQPLSIPAGGKATLTYRIRPSGTPSDAPASVRFQGSFNVGLASPSVARISVKPPQGYVTPTPDPQIASVDSNYVVTVRGKDFGVNPRIDIRWNYADVVTYGGPDLTRSVEGGLDVIRFTLTDPAKRTVLDDGGRLQLWAVSLGGSNPFNPTPIYFASVKLVPVPKPATASANAGYVVTVKGTDFEANARVDVRIGYADLVTYQGSDVTYSTEGGLDVLRFTLTDPAKRKVLDEGGKVQLWVVNPGTPSQFNPTPIYFGKQ
ncbi:MAG: hypothetical protein FWD55_00650 [Propionibacteriaceae bacterium]|nr:hypothetical protein [Propionibacteriaceae bacterium]